jgi:squalene-hopene/tetraprenyl-beta-curcumene cyclase
MSADWQESHDMRFDLAHPRGTWKPLFATQVSPSRRPSDLDSESDETLRAPAPDRARLQDAIDRTRDYLLSIQHVEGYWCGELEGDTILESEYILLLTHLGRGQSERAKRCANYIRSQQLASGGWAIYPGGPLEISASVKSYFALKIVGDSADAEHMVRAREAILAAGGAERVNSFTRFYLALLGVISYEQCPAVPPEIVLLPHWMPFNLSEMSAWSRTIIVPLSLMWAFRPVTQLPAEQGIRELFVRSPEELPASMPRCEQLDALHSARRFDWEGFFRLVDRGLKGLERWRIRPLRQRAIRKATRWMLDRFADSDGLGAIFPPIVWSIVALRCLGYADDSPEVLSQLQELERLTISEGDTDRLQPCQSPVWDTAIATIALRDADVPPEHPALQRSVEWLLSREIRVRGDWAARDSHTEPSGWAFEFRNPFYPDVDDTGMVCIALSRCLPEYNWSADFLLEDWSWHPADKDVSAIVVGKAKRAEQAATDIHAMGPILNAIHRGARWVLAMQSSDGGWGAFDKDNTREVFTRVPFADHNAMIDPSTADLTARMIEMLAGLNVPIEHSAVQKAIQFVWSKQEPDHCWYGRWGVNYLYGTWQVLVGLTAIGIPTTDPRIRRAVEWLKSKQQRNGGWGETIRSYDEPALRGQGETTASQTAWALLGLIAAGEARSDAARRGIEYLLSTQLPDGTWDETPWTGTGFPKVFYLKYHLYRIYFPLMALGRYAKVGS